MTADYTFQATPGQVAAIERDGFLVVAGPRMMGDECNGICLDSGDVGVPGYGIAYPHPDCPQHGRGVPVPTTKPCPECGGSGTARYPIDNYAPVRCNECNGDGTVPITVEVVVPERECPGCSEEGGWGCSRCVGEGRLPARTLLRGTAEAVPVVDDPDDLPGEPPVLTLRMGRAIYWPEGESGPDGLIDVTHHFADMPRPEVGDTAWIIREEGT